MGLTVEILQGNARKVKATFLVPGDDADPDDLTTWTPTDPTDVIVSRKRVRAADTTIESWTFSDDQVDRIDTGIYEIILPFATNGSWAIGARGTGDVVAYEETILVVKDAEALAP